MGPGFKGEEVLEKIVFAGTIAALAAGIISSRSPKSVFSILLRAFVLTAAASLLYILIHRSIRIGFPAITNMYEALLFFALCIQGVIIVLAFRRVSAGILCGGLTIVLILLVLASSPLFPDELRPPVPALRSNWLVLHVALAFAGEALFAVGFIGAILWFVSRDPEKRVRLNRLVYMSILAGYPVYTLGSLIFGAVWASHAWGRFWSWDPKETWALVTWLTYTYYLHSRLISKRSPRTTNLIALLGFIFTMITFLGVKYISFGADSLHSY